MCYWVHWLAILQLEGLTGQVSFALKRNHTFIYSSVFFERDKNNSVLFCNCSVQPHEGSTSALFVVCSRAEFDVR